MARGVANELGPLEGGEVPSTLDPRVLLRILQHNPMTISDPELGMDKFTFTLDEETVAALEGAAERLVRPKSQVVREAIRFYGKHVDRLSSEERDRMLALFDHLTAVLPAPGRRWRANSETCEGRGGPEVAAPNSVKTRLMGRAANDPPGYLGPGGGAGCGREAP
jgi:hypothetical protein